MDWPPESERDHGNRQTEFIVVVFFFTVTATLFAAARIYTRAFLVRSLGKDDVSLIAASLMLWASSVTSVIYMKRAKIGYHNWDVPYDPVGWASGQKMSLVNQLLYNPVLTLTKISLLLFFLRLSPSKAFHMWIWGTMVITIGLSIATFFADLFQCTPIAFFWDPSIVGGTCIKQFLFYFITAAISTATDLWILILPMPIFWGLQIPVKKRVILISLFALGAVVVVMSILRLNALHRVFFRTTDHTYDGVSIWANMELCLAVVCTSIPALRPLCSKLFPRYFTSVGVSGYKSSGGYGENLRRRGGASQGYEMEEMGGLLEGKGGSMYGTRIKDSSGNGSEEMIIGKPASELTIVSGSPDGAFAGASVR